jgi:hypothetical protein
MRSGFHDGDATLTPALKDIPAETECSGCARRDAELAVEREHNDALMDAVAVFVRDKIHLQPGASEAPLPMLSTLAAGCGSATRTLSRCSG